MSADSRTPHTDALATLGMLHQRTEGRDAIHLGVEQVVAGENLERGQPIGFGKDGKVYSSWFECEGYKDTPKCVGIVDPFLNVGTIYRGQKFWLVVLPRQITSLRHVWEHPDFKPSGETAGNQKVELPALKKELTKMKTAELRAYIEELQQAANGPTEEQVHKTELLLGFPKAVAKEYLRSVANNLGVEYDELIERATEYVQDGSYWVEGGRFEGESIGDQTKFWDAYEHVTGNKVKASDRGSFLSCSC